jgi:hypothetical protein
MVIKRDKTDFTGGNQDKIILPAAIDSIDSDQVSHTIKDIRITGR